MKLRHTPISLPAEHAWLDGLLAHAPDVRGLALVLQTQIGTHPASREAHLASIVAQAGFATLILELVTRHEDARDADIRYNVPLLATRVLAAAEWVEHQPQLRGLAIGLLAAHTGCGAAVRAAAKGAGRFSAIVCRAGRPDLAGAGPLRALTTPACFVIGAEDPAQTMLHQAFDLIPGEKDWHIVADAGAEFIEPGGLERVGQVAAAWLLRHLPPPGTVPAAAPLPAET